MSSFRTIELSDAPYECGGLRFLTVKTPNLQGRGDICLYVPQVAEGLTDLPIYILLHGVYGSAWIWAMKGGAAKTAAQMIENQEMQAAIIAMPSDGLWGDGSAYFAHHQKDFAAWICEDVVTAVRENIPQASDKSPLCIGGLSMGGYGALMLGARFPEKFKAISGHSSITKLEEMSLFVEEPLTDYTENCDLPNVIDALKMNRDHLPALRFDCGIEDDLIESNRLLHRQLTEFNIPHSYQEFAGGHEWAYWQQHVRQTFRFFNSAVSKE